ncbi:MAG: hypothetical protein AB1938_27430 [Myxococcota bacterium]
MKKLSLALLLAALSCGAPNTTSSGDGGADAGSASDAGPDAGATDSGAPDSGAEDAGPGDAGFHDGGSSDAGSPGPDAGSPDAGTDGGVRRQPPPLPSYSGGVCPTLNGGPTRAQGTNTGFQSAGDARDFYLLVPPGCSTAQPCPVVFGYHWLNASGNSVVEDADLESAILQYRFIAVVPENLMNGSNKAYTFDWPFVEVMNAPKELRLFEDILACVGQQFGVDASRVHVFGASAGGLWTTYLSTTPTVDRVASVLVVSGGLGEVLGVWSIPFVPQPNKFPAFIIWGGPTDWLGVDFHRASQRYRDALRADSHAVVACTHTEGHKIPPFPQPADGGTLFAGFWDFFRDHPYGLPPGVSPWQTSGIPATLPSYCALAP